MAPPILSADEVQYARELREWRERRGLSKKALAAAMAYDPSRVSHIEGGRQAPTEEFTRQAEAALQTGGVLWARWEAIAASRFGLTSRPVERDLRTSPFIAWLADHSAASFGSLYAAVNAAVARLETEPPSLRYGREHNRRHVGRAQLAEAIARYYREPPAGSMLYRAKVGDRRLTTSILTRPEWLDTAVPLGGDAESARFVPPGLDERPELTSAGVAAAVQRLAGVEVNGTVMVNNPLYQLLDADVAPGELSATFTTVEFADHALTTELIEGELIAAIGQSRDELPLRDAYLPTIDATFELEQRACVGGVVSLLAIARRRGDVRDYVLFTQERSSTVLNLAGKLATIPKGFHQPTGEPTHEVSPFATVRREFEEELLGRQELEQIEPLTHSHVDLLHDQHLTEPMVWLLDRPDSFRVECTGFGFNLVTGNYEFAGLVVIDDDGWWERFGHRVESNWEAERVNRHSTLDTAGLEALVGDPRWGNESLFCLLQGAQAATRGRPTQPHRRPDDRGRDVTPSWSRGNAAELSDRRGWLVGHFIDDPTDPHYSKDVEIKWGVHAAGDERTEWSAGRHDRTILILVTGRWHLELASSDGHDTPTTVTLGTQGDYVLWGKGVDHRWRAEADSVVVTVRWPSTR